MKPENCMEKVTGASKGIGGEIAKRFAAEAVSVVVNYASSKKDWDKTRKTLKPGSDDSSGEEELVARQEHLRRPCRAVSPNN
jgi:NAD(P)-dependent dehydrogenase (short-subunit alcohol dehydrogenase family)